MNAKTTTATTEIDYDGMTSQDLLVLNATCTDDITRLKIMRALRGAFRRDEEVIKEKVKLEKEDSQSEKKALKATSVAMMAARSVYLESYRDMNKLITGKSLVKHFNEFTHSIDNFTDASNVFVEALDAHKKKIETIKAKEQTDA